MQSKLKFCEIEIKVFMKTCESYFDPLEEKKVFCTKCGTAVDGVVPVCSFCGCKIYNNYNEHPPSTGDEKEITSYNFQKGYKYATIVLFLSLHHNIEISISTLKRRLQTYGFQRKICNITEDSLKQIISREIEGSAAVRGYRALWSSLKVWYRVNIKRDVVMKLLRELDPNGSENRKAHRLRRRQYVSVGRNFCWHADGYNKLKPYGLPMHGCVNVFPSKILWLTVSRNNKIP